LAKPRNYKAFCEKWQSGSSGDAGLSPPVPYGASFGSVLFFLGFFFYFVDFVPARFESHFQGRHALRPTFVP
jgi:hypothetical protein